MTDSLLAQREYALTHLHDLIQRGRRLSGALASNPADASSLAAARSWQQTCATAVHQLSGGSKSHWLSRAYSGALLVRSSDGRAVVEADVGEIVARVLEVLDQAVGSLSQIDDVAAASSSAPAQRRFDFVNSAPLRPVLERAWHDSRRALESGDYREAMMTSCGILEAIITDALERAGAPGVARWSFDERIAAAEQRGLIRGGCARLPPAARHYRSTESADEPVAAREARIASQVLRVVMRDLDPGR